ncbi:MAG: hypothetical protein UR69_C0002G0232 [Candidatus Moranbacteria bacterium GW2011_GWE2_35_2-]|nr:MAG: hypothetical protein UR69_C0002G0232 [Candidatus Moranbacteria bacterium GW2011_GWE2_35_2-]KKQ06701.1 MAG: hypothetical protein US15_C0005G0002 [Candidatus Moranbacteria bacterium GW2011_GWF1_36_4]KKQ22420.1 MAG: hypothetical protein US37_C0002G0045 [Candidatus Moranbacteria bacterium GW2011_GWF2_37_11]KKQ29489.1 MAG: hypothetical protein US44_C0001G0081 [Candidatus Moranbacteria bacterium GW2011_GWD1_37_17]KKQ30642.1 MAG: hypothetical protein US47_C0002G0232 [Candidatus Moranbacteria b
MNKDKIIGFLKIINLVAVALLGFIFLLGAASTIPALFYNHYFQFAIFGYLLAIVFGLLAFKKNIFLLGCLVGWIIFGWANSIDSKQIKEENQKLCLELRAEPSCKEDECGFNCSNFHGAGFVTGGSICNDKDMSLCQTKVKKDIKTESDTQDVLKVYSGIVDKIIASPSPANENFENQLVAIYNCLDEKFGPGATGELKAIQILKQKNLTAQQLEKYYLYHSSKGRNFTPGHITAGLTGGDKDFSCKYINVK